MQLNALRAGTAPKNVVVQVLRECRGLTSDGLPEAVVALLEDQKQDKLVRRYSAFTLGTMPCSVSRDALRRAADGTDPDPGMESQASDALEALRNSVASF